VVGCGPKSEKVRASATVKEVFVTNVSKEVAESDIREFVDKRVTILWLGQVSHPDAASKSFVLTVSLEESHIVLNPQFWPPGIQCRNFIRPKIGHLASVGR
jgi:hypothetical protein